MGEHNTVWVGNVDAEVDELTLRAVFENCGFVSQVRIAGKRGYDTVYCFVEFADQNQATLALAMDGLQLGQRQIKVSMAKVNGPPKQGQPRYNKGRIPPMNLIQAQAQDRLLQLQAFNALPLQAQLQPPLQAQLQAPLHVMQQNLQVSMPQPHTLSLQPPAQRPKRPHQDPDKVERTVYIENVAEDVDEQVLADYFGVCGEVTAVRVSGGPGPGRKAWVEFSRHKSARSAREYDQSGLGSSIIRVRPSKTAIHTNALGEFGHRRYAQSPNNSYDNPGSSGGGHHQNGHRHDRPANESRFRRRDDSPNGQIESRNGGRHSPTSSGDRRGNGDAGFNKRPRQN